MSLQIPGSKKAKTIAILGCALAGAIAAPHSASAAGLLIADGGLGGQLEIKEQVVDVAINNGIAVTNVTQVFTNLENRQVEALYTFPVPKNASVSNFSMWINGKEVVGEVLEKQRAREIYNSYKQVRKDPGLLEQTDFKTFEMRVFPIGANADQKVQITYYQELDFDHDWATYVYPLAKSTRADIKATTTGRFAFNMEVKSEVPIAKMESPSHADDISVARRTEFLYDASLEQKKGDLSRDLVVAYQTPRPSTGLDLVTSKQQDEDGYFCLMLTAGQELAAARAGGADYVFVLDVSGSMAEEGKLTASRGSIDAFVHSLAPEDRFELITFNNAPTLLFQKLTEPTPETMTKASEFLAQQRATGGTLLQPAITAAYRYADADRPLNVVILSDGMADQNDRATLMKALSERPAKAKVFCVGVGNEVDQTLLTHIAEDAGGVAAFISKGDDFTRQAAAFRRKLAHPVATNLKIDFDGVPVYDEEPRQLSSLFHGTPVRVYGRYKNGGKATITVTGDVDGQSFTQKSEFELPARQPDNRELERMWAWHRVQSLLAQGDRDGKRGTDVVNQIVALGEGYSIATEYTSFLVLENDDEYKRWKIERRNALRLGMDRDRQAELRADVARIRDKSLADIGPVENLNQVAQASAQSNSPSVRSAVPAAPQQMSNPSRGSNFSFPARSGGGGGAIDPLTCLMVLITAGGFWLHRRRLA